MKGTSDQESKAEITAKVDLQVESPCEYLLRVTDITIQNGKGLETLPLENTDIKFAMVDGEVTQVCSLHSDESKWMVNFKKGIISSFQTSVADLSKGQNVTEVSSDNCIIT